MTNIPVVGNRYPGLTVEEQGIFDIIKRNVCSKCKALSDYTTGWCYRHKERCEGSYAEQAQEIYTTFLKPYEDDLR